MVYGLVLMLMMHGAERAQERDAVAEAMRMQEGSLWMLPDEHEVLEYLAGQNHGLAPVPWCRNDNCSNMPVIKIEGNCSNMPILVPGPTEPQEFEWTPYTTLGNRSSLPPR